MAACRLGCGEARAILTDRCGETHVAELENIVELEWTRIIDDASEARVVIGVSGDAQTACCQAIGQTRPWARGLQILRDDVLVWEGPIVRVHVEYDTVEILARDVSAWLDVRTTHWPIRYGTDEDTGDPIGHGPADLSEIAEDIINSALRLDDPCILPYLTVEPSNVIGEMVVEPDEEPAGDLLRELARSGLDYTCLGRRMIVGPDIGGIFDGAGVPFVHLFDEHFASTPGIVDDGLEAATRWIVVGDEIPDSDPTEHYKGTAGGIDPYYGLIERIAKEDRISSNRLCRAAARSRLDSSNPPPVFADLSNNEGISPEAPVCINDLIPGRLIWLTLRTLCREVSQTLRLLGMSVSYDEGEEKVNLALGPEGTLGNQQAPLR